MDNIDADNADFHAINLHDGIGLNIIGGAVRCQGRYANLRLDIRGQYRRVAVTFIQEIQEFRKAGIAFIEFMVTQRKRIKTDFVHKGGIGLTLEQRKEERTRDSITGMQFQNVAAGRTQLFEFGNNSSHATRYHLRCIPGQL